MSGAPTHGHQQAPSGPKPVLVVTCGNLMGGDDAFGPLVADALRRQLLRRIEILDLRLNPASLLDHVEGRKALLIADAAVGAGLRPGQLVDVNWREAQNVLRLSPRSLSSHSPSLADQLALAEAIGQLPEFVRLIVLIVPVVEFGRPPQPLLRRRAAAAADQIRRHAKLHLMHDASSC